MKRAKQLHNLQKLTALKFQTAQRDMARLRQQEAALRQNLEQLTASKTEQAQQLRHDSSPALKAGAEIHWHQCVDQRRAKINQELATLLVQIDISRRELGAAFGRNQATERLKNKADAAQRQVTVRKANYES